MCGFANAEGGVLVIGRNDKGVAVGVKGAKKLLEDIPNKVRDVLGIMVDVNLLEEAGKELLEIRVEPYPSPISYKGEYHYRSGSTKQELKGAALSRFLLKKQGLHWDGVPVPYVGAGDLDPRILADFRKLALHSRRLSTEILNEPDPALLDKLHLVEGEYLKRAAVLLFHPDPEHFVTGAYIKIGFFENNVDLRFQDEVHGGLLSQVSRTIEILQAKYLKAWISYEGLQRIETYLVPEPALREAILNAVVHKDYASAVPIQISVYPDKLMIWNPGQLPPEWTVARLLDKHSSLPFNPDVANAFFRAGQIESWRRGIERMLDACQAARMPAPELQAEHSGLWVNFAFAAPQVAGSEKRSEKGSEKGSEIGSVATPIEEAPVKTPVKTPEQVLATLATNRDLTLAELASFIGKSTSAVERAAAKLVREGRLRFVGPRKGGHWEVLK
ncbi:MAG: ATP-binding protein [Sulfuritalea sp.]|nr:ATP-binding protein [Sulfuritalea sp.]